jgi:endonuclease-3
MEYVMDFGIPSPLVIVHDRLKAHYGRDWPVSIRSDPIDHLVFAMTSNRTLGKVSVDAFCKLRAAFQPWDLMTKAPYEEVHTCIQNITYADTYANFIPAALRLIKEKEGTLNLDFLKGWTVPKAQAWLEKLPGVGPKISAYVLNTSRLRMPALIVDTHHWRVAKLLGLINHDTPFEKAASCFERQIPNTWTAKDREDHHFMIKQIGLDFCKDGHLRCPSCPLRNDCAYGKTTMDRHPCKEQSIR